MKKSILITGCSSGIGLCAAETLHQRGYQVFATARRKLDIEKLKEKGLETVVLDIDDSHSIQRAVDEVLTKTHGRLDALFNNCGYAIPGAIEDLTRDHMRQQFETNVFGPMELTNLILPIMRKQGYGRIIQNVSILGIITMPYRGAYNASKFALEGFSNTLRQELRGTNIFVAIIEPGPITTQFRTNAYKNYLENIAQQKSIHQENYKIMEKIFSDPAKSDTRFNLEPEAVVKKLIHALESKKPKSHYFVGLPANMFNVFRRLLPDTALDWIIDRISQGEINDNK